MHLPRTIFALFISCLLLAVTVCPGAFAAQIDGISVDVANAKEGHGAELLVDNDPHTAWIGGGRSVGPGKWIELSFPAPVSLEYLEIRNGYQAKGKFDTQRRVTRGFIKYPDETSQQFTIKPTTGVQKITLLPKTVESLKIVIIGVAPSSKDKAIGKAKVAISEVTVFGEMDETAISMDATEKAPLVVEEPTSAKEEPASEPKQAEAPPQPKKAAPKQAAPSLSKKKLKAEGAPKPEPKAAPKPDPKKETAKPAAHKPTSTQPKQVASKAGPKAMKTKQAAKPKAKAKPKKTAKTQAKPHDGLASTPGFAALKSAVLVPEGDTPMGEISPWINLELVAQIKRYFALITTLHDSYPDVFINAIRDRERSAFIAFQDDMRDKDTFGQHHMAQLDHMGLSFDKPVIGDEVATVHVHGPYRYYLGNVAYEFNVDADFDFVVENEKWKIAAVKGR